MSLTPKQELFCRLVAEGKTQADAYRGSYNVKPTTLATTVVNKASKLMAKDEVRATVEKYKSGLAEKLLFTQEEAFNKLQDCYNLAIATQNVSAMINAVKEQISLTGVDAPAKHEVNGLIQIIDNVG